MEFKTSDSFIDLIPHPKPAAKYVPDWYRKMPLNTEQHKKINPSKMFFFKNLETGDPIMDQTLKACIPVRDMITAGYMVPLWNDLVFQNTEEGIHVSWLAENQHWIDAHPQTQLPGKVWLNDLSINGNHPKLICPWRFYTPEGYSSLFISPYYLNPKIKIYPAIVDTDKQHEVNFPCHFDGVGDNETIVSDTPIVQVIPFKRDNWSSEVSVIREEKFRQVLGSLHIYKRFKHTLKKFT